MKKSLLVLLLCLCCAPCFSQGVKAGLQGIKTGVKGVSAAGQIEKNLAQQVRRACANSLVTASVDNLPGKPTLPTLLGQNELYRIRMRWGNTFPSPFEDDRSAAFYRGMHLNNFEDVRNMLINGLEIKASPRGIIYTTRRPSLAVTFAVAPIQEGEFPALIRIPVTQELLRTNPPNETNAWYQSTFYQDIPSKMLEIFAFLEIDKQVGWYQITLTADNQLNFTFVENKRLLPIFEEDM